MFGRDGEQIGEAELVKLVSEGLAHRSVDLIDCQADRLTQAPEHLRQLAIGRRDLGAAVDDEDNVPGFV